MNKLIIFFVGVFISIGCNNQQPREPEFTYETYLNQDYEFQFEYPTKMDVVMNHLDGIRLGYPEKDILLGGYHAFIINDESDWVNLKEAYDQDLKSENVKYSNTEFHDEDYYFLEGIIDGKTSFMKYTINSERGFYIIEIQYTDEKDAQLCKAIVNHAKNTFKRIE